MDTAMNRYVLDPTMDDIAVASDVVLGRLEMIGFWRIV